MHLVYPLKIAIDLYLNLFFRSVRDAKFSFIIIGDDQSIIKSKIFRKFAVI